MVLSALVNVVRGKKGQAVSRETEIEFEAMTVDIELIDGNPEKFRDDLELDELMPSVQSVGIVQPIIVRRGGLGRFQVIAGERRFRAAKRAKQKMVPVVVRSVGDREAVELQAIENLTQKGLNPIERAKLLKRLCGSTEQGGFGKGIEEAAKLFKKTRPWASNLMRLLELPEKWQRALAEGEIRERMARALVPFAQRPEVLDLVEKDMLETPHRWMTSESFDASLKELVEQLDAGKEPSPETTLRPRPKAVSPEPAIRLCSAISKLKDLAALDRLAKAIDERRKELKAAAGK